MLSRAAHIASMILCCASEDIDQLAFRHRAQLAARAQRVAADHEIHAPVEYPRKLELYASDVERAEQRLPTCRTLIKIDHDINIAVRFSFVMRDGAEQVCVLHAEFDQALLVTANAGYGFFTSHGATLTETPHKVTLRKLRTDRTGYDMIRGALTFATVLSLAACTLWPTPSASPQQLLANVAAFAQPTHDARFEALKSQLDAAGLAYTVGEFTGRRPTPGKNVIVRTGPSTGKQILLTAHYDALEMQGGKLVDGVVDNAASVVAMIEATRRLKGRTKHPVTLFLTDQEELGLLGARAFITAHGVADLAAVINADINANGDTLMHGLNNGAQSARLTEAVRELCAELQRSCLDFPEYPPSDDRAFSAAGAPTVSLGHQPKAEAEKLRAFMLKTLDPAAPPPEVLSLIHTPNDRIDRVEPATLALAADFFQALVMKLDGELP